MNYLATVERADGSVYKVRVSSNDVAAVAKQLRVRKTAIRSIQLDVLYSLTSRFSKRGLSVSDQAVMLDQIASLLSTSRSPSQIVNGILKKEQTTFVDNQLFAKAQTIPQFLEAMHFDSNAILLAYAGDQSGDLKGALKKASKALFEKAELQGAVFQRIKGGVIYLGLGLLMSLAGPYMYGGQLQDIQESMGREIQRNIFTDYLFVVREFLQEFWWTLPLVVMLIIFKREAIWSKIRKTGPLRVINDIQATARSTNFLLTFSIMLASNKPNKEALTIIKDNASKNDKPIYQAMIKGINQGASLGRTFNPEDWPATMVTAMDGFDEMKPEDKLELSESIQRSLKLQLEKLSDKLAGRTKMIGTVFLAGSLVCCMIGFMLPLASVSAGS